MDSNVTQICSVEMCENSGLFFPTGGIFLNVSPLSLNLLNDPKGRQKDSW